jgi:hypothetical protein
VIVDTHLRTNTNGKKGSLCATKEKKPTKGEIKADHDSLCTNEIAIVIYNKIRGKLHFKMPMKQLRMSQMS